VVTDYRHLVVSDEPEQDMPSCYYQPRAAEMGEMGRVELRSRRSLEFAECRQCWKTRKMSICSVRQGSLRFIGVGVKNGVKVAYFLPNPLKPLPSYASGTDQQPSAIPDPARTQSSMWRNAWERLLGGYSWTQTSLRACYELAFEGLLSSGCERKHEDFGSILVLLRAIQHNSTAFVTGS
jgi:hypothetical protein